MKPRQPNYSRSNKFSKPGYRRSNDGPMRTDWNNVAKWYGKHLQSKDTYQSTLIFPKTLKLLEPKPGKHYLDIACGEGSFAIKLSQQVKAEVTGFDLAKDLIAQAKKKAGRHVYFLVGDAMHFPDQVMHQQFDGATCILALQNITDFPAVFQRAARVLKPGSPFVIVLNHPTFRPPKQSGWGFDEQRKLQYRRIDSYLTPYHVALAAHPGERASEHTMSFHHPLQDYVKGLAKAGFMIDALEEWTSDRTSQPGGKAKAENRSRQEFPLFLAIRAIKTN